MAAIAPQSGIEGLLLFDDKLVELVKLVVGDGLNNNAEQPDAGAQAMQNRPIENAID